MFLILEQFKTMANPNAQPTKKQRKIWLRSKLRMSVVMLKTQKLLIVLMLHHNSDIVAIKLNAGSDKRDCKDIKTDVLSFNYNKDKGTKWGSSKVYKNLRNAYFHCAFRQQIPNNLAK